MRGVCTLLLKEKSLNCKCKEETILSPQSKGMLNLWECTAIKNIYLQDVDRIEREMGSNGAFRSNRQFGSNQTSLHSADMMYTSLCYDFRAIHISIGLI